MTSKLEKIPPELYRNITQYLDPSSLVSLHRSTKSPNIKAESKRTFMNIETKTILKLIKDDNLNALKRLFKYFHDTKNIQLLQELYEYAIKNNADKVTKFLQDHVQELDVNVYINGQTPLEIFTTRDKLELTKSINKHPKFQPNKEAVLINAHGEHAIELLKHPCINCNIEKHQQTPLGSAVTNIDVKKVNALMNHPKIKPNKKLSDNKTALHLAVENPSYNNTEKVKTIVNRLLQHPKTNPNLKTIEGETALHSAIKTEQPIQVLHTLVKHPKVKLHPKTKPLRTQSGDYIPGKTPLDYADIYEHEIKHKLKKSQQNKKKIKH